MTEEEDREATSEEFQEVAERVVKRYRKLLERLAEND